MISVVQEWHAHRRHPFMISNNNTPSPLSSPNIFNLILYDWFNSKTFLLVFFMLWDTFERPSSLLKFDNYETQMSYLLYRKTFLRFAPMGQLNTIE